MKIAMRALGVVGLLAASFSLGSCSLLLDTSDAQCHVDADCRARGLSSATCVNEVCSPGDGGADSAQGPWTCLGQVGWPSTGSAKAKLSLPIVDVLTSKPPTGVAVRLCPKLDPACASPLAGSASVNVTTGMLEATVDAGFDGYLELSSPSIATALFFVTKPVWRDTVLSSVLPVVSKAGFEQIATAIGTTLDLTTKGHVYVLASDCLDAPAAGVRFEIDTSSPTTKSYYMIKNVPVGDTAATDVSGSGGFLNLSPGFAKVTGYVAASGARVGEAGFAVRAGAVSYLRVLPTP